MVRVLSYCSEKSPNRKIPQCTNLNLKIINRNGMCPRHRHIGSQVGVYSRHIQGYVHTEDLWCVMVARHLQCLRWQTGGFRGAGTSAGRRRLRRCTFPGKASEGGVHVRHQPCQRGRAACGSASGNPGVSFSACRWTSVWGGGVFSAPSAASHSILAYRYRALHTLLTLLSVIRI